MEGDEEKRGVGFVLGVIGVAATEIRGKRWKGGGTKAQKKHTRTHLCPLTLTSTVSVTIKIVPAVSV
jgi:hypothetical protein